jgi:hypothetical protein
MDWKLLLRESICLFFILGLLAAQPQGAIAEKPEMGELSAEFPMAAMRVGVFINGETGVEGKVKSYVNRELRSLGDVINTETECLYEMHIIAIENRNERGQLSGYALAVITLNPYTHSRFAKDVRGAVGRSGNLDTILFADGGTIIMAFADELDNPSEQQSEYFKEEFKSLYYYEGSKLYTAAYDELEGLSKRIVADFDNTTLEQHRLNYQGLLNMYQELVDNSGTE